MRKYGLMENGGELLLKGKGGVNHGQKVDPERVMGNLPRNVR